MKYLSKHRLIRIHDKIVAETHEDPTILIPSNIELALEAPRRTSYGYYAYSTLQEKAAVLMHELIKLHPFLEANKRTAFTATDLFLRMNGKHLEPELNNTITVSVETASCLRDVPYLSNWVSQNWKRP